MINKVEYYYMYIIGYMYIILLKNIYSDPLLILKLRHLSFYYSDIKFFYKEELGGSWFKGSPDKVKTISDNKPGVVFL
jgi:hypothetical protein